MRCNSTSMQSEHYPYAVMLNEENENVKISAQVKPFQNPCKITTHTMAHIHQFISFNLK